MSSAAAKLTLSLLLLSLVPEAVPLSLTLVGPTELEVAVELDPGLPLGTGMTADSELK